MVQIQTMVILEALNITPSEVLNFDLRRLMAHHHVTIKSLAAHMGVSHDRVRAVRSSAPRDLLVRVDYIEAVRHVAH